LDADQQEAGVVAIVGGGWLPQGASMSAFGQITVEPLWAVNGACSSARPSVMSKKNLSLLWVPLIVGQVKI
jgi:hypothetical protein